jgi:hypothetical protein
MYTGAVNLGTCDNGAYVLVHSSTATCDAKSSSPGFSAFQLPVGDSSCVGGVYSTSGSFCKIRDCDVAIWIRLHVVKPVESAIFIKIMAAGVCILSRLFENMLRIGTYAESRCGLRIYN